MLVELAIGDAYGCAFECSEQEFVEENNTLEYVDHNRYPSVVARGHYTDDTQMTIAIAEAMIDGVEWTPLNVADYFLRAFKRDERRGYNGGFFHFLKNTNTAQEFLDEIRPKSEKSGAAMRATPLGLLADLREIHEKNRIQAALTHATLYGIRSAQVSALMTHYFRWKVGPKDELISWLQSQVESDGWESGEWDQPRVRSLGWHAVRAAATAIQWHESMADILKQCIAFTGDTDTVATIALAAASWSDEVKQNLPENLYQGLENKAYGRDFLAALEVKLLDKIARLEA